MALDGLQNCTLCNARQNMVVMLDMTCSLPQRKLWQSCWGAAAMMVFAVFCNNSCDSHGGACSGV
jgi:hypothetical protein